MEHRCHSIAVLAALAGRLVLAGLSPQPAFAQASNGVLREVFLNIPGSSLADLTNNPAFPNSPSLETLEPVFEAPTDWTDDYGTRMRAWVVPPSNGIYYFWISSDDQSALFLSTDDTPAKKSLIAWVNGWTSARAWTTEANQASAGLTLTGGQRYYIEALQKEGGGGDNLAVRWQLPSGTIEEPIPNNRLVAYGLGPPLITQQPTNAAVVEGDLASFNVALAHMIGTSFQWSRNGTNIPGATNSSQTVGPVSLADSDSLFRCSVVNAYGSTNTTDATLTVLPDTTKPTLLSVGNVGERKSAFVVFSEPVEAASATNAANYLINGGVTTTAAAFGADTKSIILTTTPLVPDQAYTLTVNNVRDRATTPNAILPNSQLTFSESIRPLDVDYLSLPREPLGPSTRRQGVVISEVMYHPTNRTDGRKLEFVEIFNSQPWFEELGGWRLSGAIDYVFPSNTVLGARSFLVVAANPADFQSVYTSVPNVYGPFLGSNGLQNSSGTLRLRNDRDAVQFEMSYSGDPPFPAAADGAGHSLVLARPSYGEADPRAWAASDLVGGNPGATNGIGSNPYRTVLINEFLAHTDLPQEDFIELFNYGNAAVNLGGCTLSDDAATNKFIIPTNTMLAAQSFIAFTQTQLGFALSASGEKIFFKNPNGTRVLDAVSFDAQENGVSMGRYPDGAPSFTRLASPTFGTNNAPFRATDVVINEIMFDPISSDSADEYIELFNRSTNAVDLGGWRLRGGISFNIPNGTTLAAGGYLVIAKNEAHLRANYAQLSTANCLGDYSGTLANGGERVELNMPDQITTTNDLGQPVTDTIHIAVDEVTYGPGGRWGRWAGGGGSSLELVDARSDRRLAPNWADSDETTKSPWVNVEVTGVMDNGWAEAYQLHITLQGAGECLLDNVEVIPSGSTNLITNGTFDTGTDGWTFQGNQNQTSWEPNEGCNSVGSLHLRSTGRGDTGANRVRVQLPYTLTSGTTVTLRAKARWLKGNPNLLLRLRGNYLEAPGTILTAKNLGTPGLPNSRAAVNTGPAITGVRHDPPLPAASQPVLVLARVHDPDGVAYLAVNYRLDPSTNYTTLTMTNNGAGLYSAVIPGQVSGTMAAFFIQAMDNFAPPASRSFPDNAPARECLVRWGDTNVIGDGRIGTYRFWLTQTNLAKWVAEEKMSNNPKDVTFVYGRFRVIYNAGAMFHGSPYHSPGYNSPVGNMCDYDAVFPDDDRLLGETDINLFRPGNGGGDGTGQAEIHGYWFGRQFGIPFLYHRPVVVFFNAAQRGSLFHDAQQPNGGYINQWFPDDPDGDLHKIQFGFEFGDQAYGSGETGYAIVGASLGRYTTTGGVFKQARYRQTWPLRSASPTEQNDYTNIFALVTAAQTTAGVGSAAYTTVLTNATDVEEWFKVHVTQHLFGNGDSFSYGGGQNAFAYKPQHDTWKLFLWDIDFAFGGTASDATFFIPAAADHGPRSDHPPFRRIYWQALIEAANGMMTPERSEPILDSRYNGMIAGGASVGSPSGIKTFIATKRGVLLSVIAGNQAPFAIASNGGADFSTNRNLVVLTGTAPLEVRTILINGVSYPLTWTTVSNWSIRLPLVSGINTLQVTGIDPKGALVAGVSGTLNVTYTGMDELPQNKVVINEIMYNPVMANASYVEIYNSSASNAFDLSGWRLDGVDFTFPSGTVIDPGAFLVLAKDKAAFATSYGSSISVLGEFLGSLANGGETLTLIQPGATSAQDVVIDQVTYDNHLPWSPDANGLGASLQLIDAVQDNSRVADWTAVPTNAPPPPMQWQYVTASGVPTSTRLYVYLQTAGDVYIDDLKIVPGTVPEVGVNSVQNGDFESAFPGPWTVSANHSGSVLSTDIKHSGNSSLHVIASSGGTTAGSAIWQDCSPALLTTQTYTLSFWYLQSTNGGPLTVRLSGSAIAANVTIAPPGGTNAARYTPGAVNSARATLAPFPTLWLNEVLPTNFFLGTNGMVDRAGDRDPWVELYNGGTNSLSLNGCYLANNFTNLMQWAFPATATIGPKQFLLVWLDGETNESSADDFHASFRAAPDLGSVVLSRGANSTSIIDYLNYDVPTPGRSYGSFPDGAVSGRRLFGTTTPGATNNPAYPPLTVWINEWMADNASALADPADGKFEDWFELYNPGPEAADLSGYFLSDTLTNTTQWAIPDRTVIPAGGFLLVWADGSPGENSPSRPDIHAGFSLAKGGEAIGLFAPDGQLIDGVTFGPQITDVSQGRFPDGASAMYLMTNATPRAANLLPTANTPPMLALLADRNIDEGSRLSFSAVATDTNVPAQVLTFSLLPGAPAGTRINATNGMFTWTPDEAQGPGVYPVRIRVADNGVPSMSATQTVTITVNEVNSAPVLASILSQTVNEGSLLTVTNSATDSDTDPQTLTFSLDPGTPTNMTINAANGLIQWTPTEAQGPGSYSITVRVTDSGTPPLSDAKSFTIWVNELNMPPQLFFETNWVVNAGNLLAFTAVATDSDLPTQLLRFYLDAAAPPGASIDPSTGQFTWTPTLAQGPATNVITISVTDGSAITSRSFTVRINDKQPPTFLFWTNGVVSVGAPCQAFMPDLTATNYLIVRDNWSSVTVTQSVPTNTPLALGTNWVVLTASDAATNVAWLTNYVLVADTTPPRIVCPENLSLSTDTDANAKSNVVFTPSASDNCTISNTTCAPPSGSAFAIGVTTVTCTTTDSSGNSAQCHFTVTVADTEPPRLTCPSNMTVSVSVGQCSRSNVTYATTATDNVAVTNLLCVPPSGTTFAVGPHPVACTAADSSGNTAQCGFLITVTDDEAPQITCPGDMAFGKDSGQAGKTNVTFAVTATDNCAVTNLSCAPPSDSTFPVGTNLVLCTTADSSGHIAQCSFHVTVSAFIHTTTNETVNLHVPDGTSFGLFNTLQVSTPIERIADVKVTLNLAGGFNGDLFAYLVHDSGTAILLNRVGRTLAQPWGYSDGGFNVTLDDQATLGDIHTYRLALSGHSNTPLGGPLTGMWQPDGRGTDPSLVLDTDPRTETLNAFAGLNPNGGWTLFVADLDPVYASTLVSWGLEIHGTNTPPVITGQPQSRTNLLGTEATFRVAATAEHPVSYQWYLGPAALAGETNSVLTIPHVMPQHHGDYRAVASSVAGATTSLVARLTVLDVEPPQIIFWTNLVVTLLTNCEARMPDLTGPNFLRAVDDSGFLTATQSVATNTLLSLGVNEVVLGVFDAAGNAVYGTNQVLVVDPSPPVITCPGDLSLLADPGQLTRSNVSFAVTATDNCAVTSFFCVPPSGSTFAAGRSAVNCVAQNSSGDTSACSFTVEVLLLATNTDVVNFRVPDGSPVGLVCSVNVSTAIERITNVTVTLNLAGGFNGDLYAYLVHDSGHAVLLNRVGKTLANPSGYNDAGFHVTFDDHAPSGDIHNYRLTLSGLANTPLAGPLADAWAPDGRDTDPALVLDTDPRSATLSAFDGLDPNGRWTLFIADLDAAYASTMVSWALEIRGTSTPPVITAQPQSRTNLLGTDAAFVVAVTAGSPISYQWHHNSIALAGETNATLHLAHVLPAQSGDYFVVARSVAGSISSQVAHLTVLDVEPPRIIFWTNLLVTLVTNCEARMPDLTGPNFLLAEDDSGFLSVTQSVATNTLLSLGVNEVVLGVFDAAGNAVYGTNHVLVVDPSPPVLTCPGDLSVLADPGQLTRSNVSFAVTVTDNCAVTNFFCIPPSGSSFVAGRRVVNCVARNSSGASSECSFTVEILLLATNRDAANVRVPDGSPVGLVSTLDVATPIEHITNLTVTLDMVGGFNGDLFAYLIHDSGHAILLNRVGKTLANPSGYTDAGFHVTFDDRAANGDIHNYRLTLSGHANTPLAGPLTGAWAPDGRDTDPALVLDTDPRPATLSTFDSLDPNGRWTLFIADLDAAYASTLVSWALEIRGTTAPPVITAQPQSRTNAAGTTAQFTVAATGGSSLSYQWWFNGTNLLAGATASTLTLANVQPAQAGAYRIVVANALGSATSEVATLTVLLSNPPRLSDVLAPDGLLQFRFGGIAGQTYSVLWREFLDSGDWQPLTNISLLSSNHPVLIQDATAGQTQRFYRVVIPMRE